MSSTLQSLTLTKLINFYKVAEFDSKDDEIKKLSSKLIIFMSNDNGLKYYECSGCKKH